MFDANVRGTLLEMKHEFRVMRQQGFGSIVNVPDGYFAPLIAFN